MSQFTTDFRNDWDSILEKAEKQPSRGVLMENESNKRHKINEFYSAFDIEDQLLSQRVTKIFENLQ